MVSNIRGKRFCTWRAVDDEGEVLDHVVQNERDIAVASKLLGRLLRNQRVPPISITTDGRRFYCATRTQLGLEAIQRSGRLRDDNRVENSHLIIRRRERKIQGFKS